MHNCQIIERLSSHNYVIDTILEAVDVTGKRKDAVRENV